VSSEVELAFSRSALPISSSGFVSPPLPVDPLGHRGSPVVSDDGLAGLIPAVQCTQVPLDAAGIPCEAHGRARR
jgi:hypothetical protein